MNRRHLYALSALLIASGLSVAIYKHRVLGYPLLPEIGRASCRERV